MLVAGCGLTAASGEAASAGPEAPVLQRGDPVSIYMQNLTDAPVEFTIIPVGNPPSVFAVSPGDVGAACTRLPPDWQLAQTETGKAPGEADVLAIVARSRPGGDARSIWVSTEGGVFTNGDGVPDWWIHEAQSCALPR